MLLQPHGGQPVLEALHLDETLLACRPMAGKQVIANPRGLPIVHVEAETLQLREDGIDRGSLTVRVVPELCGARAADDMRPSDEPWGAGSDAGDVLQLRKTLPLELLEVTH